MKTTAFKNTDIGPIPADWEVKEIANIAPLQRGFDLPTTSIEDGPYPVVYSNGILAHHTIGPCKAPGIITGRSGTIGSFLFVENGRYWPHNTTLWVTSFCGNDPKFVFYLYSHIGFDRFSGGTGVPTLNRNDVHVFKTAIPPSVSEQRRIAAALSDTDELVASLDKLIEKKKRVKEGAMQRLLSGETRLPGFTGKWEIENFGEAFMFLRNNTLPRACLSDQGTVSDIHYGDVLIRYGSILDFAKETPPFIGSPFKQNVPCEFLQDGDLVVADTAEDETTGKAVEIVNLKTRKAVAGLHTIPCRPHRKFAPGWLGFYVNSSIFHDQLLPLMSGTKVLSVSRESLKSVFIARPEEKEQRAIAAVLADMDAEIAALSRERAEAERIKQGMMQELLTGKTRLGNNSEGEYR